MMSRALVKLGILSLLVYVAFLLKTQVDALDKKTHSALTHYIVAATYEKMGDIDKAIAEYQQALKIDYKNAVIHVSLGAAYLKKHEFPRAVEELNLAVKLDPESVEPHAILALLYFSQEKLTEAGKEYELALKKAAALEPQNVAIYKSLAAVYLQQKDYQAAENTYQLIIKLSPNDAETHFFLGNVYDLQQRWPETQRELQQAIAFKPDYHEALNYLGYLYVEKGLNLNDAERLIKRAVELEPENGAYIDSLGWLYYKQGKFKDAVRELERAAALIDDPVVLDHLGDTYLKLRDMNKARASWEKSLQLDPAQDTVKKKIEETRLHQ